MEPIIGIVCMVVGLCLGYFIGWQFRTIDVDMEKMEVHWTRTDLATEERLRKQWQERAISSEHELNNREDKLHAIRDILDPEEEDDAETIAS